MAQALAAVVAVACLGIGAANASTVESLLVPRCAPVASIEQCRYQRDAGQPGDAGDNCDLARVAGTSFQGMLVRVDDLGDQIAVFLPGGIARTIVLDPSLPNAALPLGRLALWVARPGCFSSEFLGQTDGTGPLVVRYTPTVSGNYTFQITFAAAVSAAGADPRLCHPHCLSLVGQATNGVVGYSFQAL